VVLSFILTLILGFEDIPVTEPAQPKPVTDDVKPANVNLSKV